jgi:hypothetical protein
VERRAGRNNLPERKDMMTDDGSVESVGDGPASASYKAIYKALRSMPYAITAALHYKPTSCNLVSDLKAPRT